MRSMSSGSDASGVRQARERFLSVGRLDPGGARPDVLDSWRRSRALGVQPDHFDLPFVREPNADSPSHRRGRTRAAPDRRGPGPAVGERDHYLRQMAWCSNGWPPT